MGELASSTTPVSFNQLTDAISVEAWVHILAPSGTLTARIVDKNTPSSTDGFFFDLVNGRPRLQVGTQSITAGEADTVYANGTWTHLVGTWRAGSSPAMALYLDGTPLTATPAGAAPTQVPRNMVPFRIGGAGTMETRMNGRIADVRVYCSALTPEQVRAVYVRDCYRIPTAGGDTACILR